jgi:hypothetical protein
MKNHSLLKVLAASLALLSLFVGVAAWWGYGHLTNLVQKQLQGFAGTDLTIGRVVMHWNRVELEQVRLARHGSGPFDNYLSIGRLVLHPRLVSLLSKRLELGEIIIDKPCLLLEIAPDGALVKPLSTRSAPARTKEGSPHPVTVSSLRITDGTVDILDWHAARRGGIGLSNPREHYHVLQLNGIDLDLGSTDFPLSDRAAQLRLTVKSRGGGSMSLNGTFSPQSLNGSLKLDIKDLNIVHYRPYFLKNGDMDVRAGLLSVHSDISVENRQLNAPGELLLKGLAFDQSGARGFWMGLPTKALLNTMEDSKGDLRINFAIKGSLDNPSFKVRQSLMEQVATGLSSRIGVVSPSNIGKGLMDAGSSGAKGLLKVFGK